MIPKVIHYCWFGGGKLPRRLRRCIASWRKYCPDYAIVEWNEQNFDISMNGYTAACYAQGKYAFLSDYVRLWVIASQGGVYLDTDVELLRPIDDLLALPAWFGFETNEYINSGLGFGAEPDSPVIKAMLERYTPLLDGRSGTVGCPKLNTEALAALGLVPDGTLQTVAGATVFPADRFNPYDDATGRLTLTGETYSIHWYAKSWMSWQHVLRSRLTKPLHRLFGKDCLSGLKK